MSQKQKKVALLFPGQGSQYVGMGKVQSSENNFLSFFQKADQALGFSLSQLCFEGPLEDLTLTAHAQPAIVTHSLALFHQLLPFLEENNIQIEKVLGHSVGEYSALCAAGAINFEDAVKAVHFRGKYMQESTPIGLGKMVAILRAPEEKILQACEFASNDNEIVSPANFNDPQQIVISGHSKACDLAVAWLEENVKERFRAIPLNVSAPFHCALMKPAGIKLGEKLEEFSWHPLKLPYVANVDAQEYAQGVNPDVIKKNLVQQMWSSVRWTQSILTLSSDVYCVEVGPGKVLQGLVKKINPALKVISLDSENSFQNLEEFFI